jgi:hypothetical protein
MAGDTVVRRVVRRRISSCLPLGTDRPDALHWGWTGNEIGAFLVQAGLGSPRDHGQALLLALNGCGSAALGADIW